MLDIRSWLAGKTLDASYKDPIQKFLCSFTQAVI